MRTITTTILIALLSIVSIKANAQNNDKPNPKRLEKIKSMHIAMLGSALNLDEATSQKFWPVYNAYTAERKAIRMQKKEANKVMDNREKLSETEMTKAINTLANCNQQEVDLQKKYNTEFLKVISAKQLAAMYNAERNFKELLIERVRGAKNRRGGGPFRRQSNIQQID
jgi:Spy/CpxP family protein refolding chaperone